MDVFNAAFSDRPVTPTEPVKDETPVETPETPVEEPKTETAPVETTPPEADKTTENAQTRDTNGKFVKTVPHEALHAERQRRLEVEAKLAELEKKPKTSVLEDEDKAFSERLSEATRPLVQRFFNLSVAAAKRAPGREDYQEVYDFMNEEVQKHPELMRDIDASDDPGEYIYQLGKTRRELSEVGGDITKLAEHATAKVKAELVSSKERIKTLEQEVAALKSSQEKREKIPLSTNAEPSGAVKDDVFAGPTPLKSIFG
jgi:hypothetical protein